MIAPARLISAAAIGGICAIAIGAFAIWEGAGYTIGTARQMGPGYFPVVLGGMLVGLGLLLVVQGLLGRAEPAERTDLRALAVIVAAIAAFALLVERAGLVPAVLALVIIGSGAAGRFRPVPVLLLAAAMSALSYLVFSVLLGLPLPAFAALR